jgi:hypothetical protein
VRVYVHASVHGWVWCNGCVRVCEFVRLLASVVPVPVGVCVFAAAERVCQGAVTTASQLSSMLGSAAGCTQPRTHIPTQNHTHIQTHTDTHRHTPTHTHTHTLT